MLPLGVVFGVLVTIAAASPTRTVPSFYSVGVIKRHNDHGVSPSNGTSVLVREREYLEQKHAAHADFARRGAVIPASSTALSTANAPFVWSAVMTAGTNNPQHMDFDTGSADIWSNKYTPGATAQNANKQPFIIAYGGGATASGTTYTDAVTVAGLTASPQDINAVTNGGAPYTTDGIFGMGFQSLSRQGSVPFVQNLKAQGAISSAVFGFRLGSAAQNPVLVIGGRDSTRFSGSLAYSAVQPAQNGDPQYWTIRLQGVTVGATTIVDASDSQLAVIDTGSTGISASQPYVAAFYAAIPKAMTSAAFCSAIGRPGGDTNTYVVPCYGQQNSGPGYVFEFPRGSLITFTFGGQTFTMPYSALVATGPFSQQTYQGLTWCTGAVMVGTYYSSSSMWTVGDSFMLNTYAEFDYDNFQVGFAYST